MYVVTDMSMKGKHCKPGYDAHFVSVKFVPHGNGKGDFYPLPSESGLELTDPNP